MSADHRAEMGFNGQLQFKVVKHSPIKRLFNKVRRTRVADVPDINLLKSMRG